MKKILDQITASGTEPSLLFIGIGVVLAVFLVVYLFCRLFIGKDSLISGSIYTSIAILFIYAGYVLLYALRIPLPRIHLPFAEIAGDMLVFFSFESGVLPVCREVLSMLLLALIASLIEHIIPRGQKLLHWALFRLLMVVTTVAAYTALSALISRFIDTKIQEYSSVAVLSSLALLLSTGSLNFLAGTALSSLSPVIAPLFSFFFLSVMGKKILKALVITALFILLVLLLQNFFISAVPVTLNLLVLYVPFALVAAVVWRLLGKLM